MTDDERFEEARRIVEEGGHYKVIPIYPPDAMPVIVSVRMPGSLYSSLKAQAEHEGTTISEIIRLALADRGAAAA